MIKEMLRLDQFYSVVASRMVIHKDYPPFPFLVEFFWTHVSGAHQKGASQPRCKPSSLRS